MTTSSTAVPESQTENEIVDAIVGLDWNSDFVTPALEIISNHVRGLEEKQIIDLFIDLQKRNRIISKPEHAARNVAYTGPEGAGPMRARWIRGDEDME